MRVGAYGDHGGQLFDCLRPDALVGAVSIGLLGALVIANLLVSLTLLKKLDPIMKKDSFLTLAVTAINREGLIEELQEVFTDWKLETLNPNSHVDLVANELFYQVVITQQTQHIGHELTETIKKIEGIKKIHYH